MTCVVFGETEPYLLRACDKNIEQLNKNILKNKVHVHVNQMMNNVNRTYPIKKLVLTWFNSNDYKEGNTDLR